MKFTFAFKIAVLTIFWLYAASFSQIVLGEAVSITGSDPAIRIDKISGKIVVATLESGLPVLHWMDKEGNETKTSSENAIDFVYSSLSFIYIWDLDLDSAGNAYLLVEKSLADIWLLVYHFEKDEWGTPFLIEDRTSTGGRAYVGNIAVEAEGVVHETHWSQKQRGSHGLPYNKISDALSTSPQKETLWLVVDGQNGESPDIAFTTDGKLYAFQKGDGNVFVPVVRTWNGQSFDEKELTGYSGNHVAEVVGGCADYEGNAHFVFSAGPNHSSNYGISVASSNEDWEVNTLEQDVGGTPDGVGPDIAVDQNGTSYVIYQVADVLKLYTKTKDGSWEKFPEDVANTNNTSREHAKISAYENYAAVVYQTDDKTFMRIIQSSLPVAVKNRNHFNIILPSGALQKTYDVNGRVIKQIGDTRFSGIRINNGSTLGKGQP
ncbi:MAG: hypothetical protein HQK83_16170 [Fibrobacteria bacterium]|nr:hypothetical protein [Fibrobacteria bacterium]